MLSKGVLSARLFNLIYGILDRLQNLQFFYSVGTSDLVGAFLVPGLERPYL